MKFVSAFLSIVYLGTLYLAHAEKRNVRRIEKTTTGEETLVVGAPLPGKIPKHVEGHDEDHDHIHTHDELVHNHHLETPNNARRAGTVTSFDVVGKGATPAVENTVVVVEEYPKRPVYGGPSKGGRYYAGYGGYGKGKGGRYGYYYGKYDDNYYGRGKGKGGRYYYQGPRERVVDTTVVKEVVTQVGKGAH